MLDEIAYLVKRFFHLFFFKSSNKSIIFKQCSTLIFFQYT